MANLGLLESIATAIDTRTLNPETPMIFDGDQLGELLPKLTSDFATRLRDCTDNTDGENPSGLGNNGILLTFHREGIPLSENDNLTADGLTDEAGVVYESPSTNNVLKSPRLPLPEDVIKYIQLRVATTRLSVPQKSDYDLFKELEAEDSIGFGHPKLGMIKPDAMVIATCQDGKWTPNMVMPYSNIGLSPNMQALHYGSAEFEGMTAEIGKDGNVYIFGMKEHYTRYRNGAIKQGIQYVTYESFCDGIIKAVQQNARFIPACGKGRLYIRQHAADIGAQMRVGNSKVSAFFVEVTPIGAAGAYFGKPPESAETGKNVPMKVLGIPDNKLRSPEGQGLVKGVGNYSHTPPVIDAVKAMNLAKEGEKALHPDGVLYLSKMVEGLDPKSEEFRSARVCEGNAANLLLTQNLPNRKYKIVTPTLEHGDILPGNTRMLILAKAREMGWEVEERDVTIGELMDGKFDAAISCGTAAMISPVDAIHFLHIKERSIEDDNNPDVPKMLAEPIGTFIQIRNQEAVNENPMPKVADILMDQMLAVKTGSSGEADKERYLTRVPGLRAREIKEVA